MSLMILRASVKDDCVTQVDQAVEKMFAAIDEAEPKDVRYASCKAADGTTYVILLESATASTIPSRQCRSSVRSKPGSRTGWPSPQSPSSSPSSARTTSSEDVRASTAAERPRQRSPALPGPLLRRRYEGGIGAWRTTNRR